MEKYRVLFVAQEMDPYLLIGHMADVVRRTALAVQDSGMEIRVLMPRFGNINERRNRLHEVVRLSGINIVIDGDDYPLIIKVGSLPGARIQVYFLDNEEFYKRKFVFRDEDDKFYDDNSERMVFFCKGVLETVKKFGWAPHVIHCHGWMTSLIPMYLKTVYANDPVFNTAKVVFSVYGKDFEEKFNSNFLQTAKISEEVTQADLDNYKAGDHKALNLAGVSYSDAVIIGDDKVGFDAEVIKTAGKKPVLPYEGSEVYMQQYVDFYKMLLS